MPRTWEVFETRHFCFIARIIESTKHYVPRGNLRCNLSAGRFLGDYRDNRDNALDTITLESVADLYQEQWRAAATQKEAIYPVYTFNNTYSCSGVQNNNTDHRGHFRRSANKMKAYGP